MFLTVAITVLYLYHHTVYISKLFLNSRNYIKFIYFQMNQYNFYFLYSTVSYLWKLFFFFTDGANSVISNLSLCRKGVNMTPCSSSRSFGIKHVTNNLIVKFFLSVKFWGSHFFLTNFIWQISMIEYVIFINILNNFHSGMLQISNCIFQWKIVIYLVDIVELVLDKSWTGFCTYSLKIQKIQLDQCYSQLLGKSFSIPLSHIFSICLCCFHISICIFAW